jgi:lipoate-protein ligase A
MLTVYDEPFPPSLDTAVSHALLRLVAAGELGESLRLYRPEPIVAFGKRDAISAGFATAVNSATRAGYSSVIRMAGGRAAVFHEDTIAFAWTIPSPAPRDDITQRFERLSGLLVETLRNLGADARIGEIPGEYCPGEFSINVGGLAKVMGVGQRLIAGAAHVGGVIVVDGGRRIAEVLVPVYADLGLEWDPATSGDLASEVPGISWITVRDAVLRSFEEISDLEQGEVPQMVLARARQLEPQHRAI